MTTSVNAGARLDRLPVSSFHYRIFWLVGAGMFFDGYDLYVAGGVLAATLHTHFSTLHQNLQFLSTTFVGMTLGSLIFGFVIFLPQFFLRQGLNIAHSLAYTLVLSISSLVGCAVGAWAADFVGRRMSIIAASVCTIVFGWIYARFNAASDPAIVLAVGSVLIVAIYVQTAMLFGVYTPELFPTEIRLRANGICNTLGRGATVISPFIVGSLMVHYHLPGVIGLMIVLLIVQILVVWAWGVEPRNRALEDVAYKASKA